MSSTPFSASLYSRCAILWTCTLLLIGWALQSGLAWVLPVTLTALPLFILQILFQPGHASNPELKAQKRKAMAKVAKIVADNVQPAIVESLEGLEVPSTTHSCEILNATIAESWGNVSDQLEELIADSISSCLYVDGNYLTERILNELSVDVCLGDVPPTLTDATVKVDRASKQLVLTARMRFSPDGAKTGIKISLLKYYCTLGNIVAEAPFKLTLPLENLLTNFGVGMQVYLVEAPQVTFVVGGRISNACQKFLPKRWVQKFERLKSNLGQALLSNYFETSPAPYLIYPYDG